MQVDAKMQRLAQLSGRPPATNHDLVAIARCVELTEFRAGTVVAPAGVPGRWCTRVVQGSIAATNPAVRHSEGSVLVHGPETALLAITDVVLLTLAEQHVAAVAAIAPGLLTPRTHRDELAADGRSLDRRPASPASRQHALVQPIEGGGARR